MILKLMLLPKSPRMVPGSASSGLVFPIIMRMAGMTLSPSHTMATTGPGNKTTSPQKRAGRYVQHNVTLLWLDPA